MGRKPRRLLLEDGSCYSQHGENSRARCGMAPSEATVEVFLSAVEAVGGEEAS